MNLTKEQMDEITKEQMDEITKAVRDSLVFGTGLISYSSEHGIKHVPFIPYEDQDISPETAEIIPICPVCRMPETEHDKPMFGHPEQKLGCRGYYFGTNRNP